MVVCLVTSHDRCLDDASADVASLHEVGRHSQHSVIVAFRHALPHGTDGIRKFAVALRTLLVVLVLLACTQRDPMLRLLCVVSAFFHGDDEMVRHPSHWQFILR